MRFKETKKEAEVGLPGVQAAFTIIDGSLRDVRLTDASGRVVLLSCDYGLHVSVPAPPKMVKRWKLSGTFAGFPTEHLYPNKWEAERKRDAMVELLRDESAAALTIEEVEVPDDDA